MATLDGKEAQAVRSRLTGRNPMASLTSYYLLTVTLKIPLKTQYDELYLTSQRPQRGLAANPLKSIN